MPYTNIRGNMDSQDNSKMQQPVPKVSDLSSPSWFFNNAVSSVFPLAEAVMELPLVHSF